jgi:hypothetical protein
MERLSRERELDPLRREPPENLQVEGLMDVHVGIVVWNRHEEHRLDVQSPGGIPPDPA